MYTGTYRSVWKVDLRSGRVQSIPNDRALVDGAEYEERITPLEVHVAPNDHHVAIVTGRRLLITEGLGGGQTRVIDTGLTQLVDARWAPDGQHLLYSDGVTYYVVNAVTGALLSIGSKAEGTMAVWSDDGRRISLVDGYHGIDVTIVGLDGSREHIPDAGDLLKDGWDWPVYFTQPSVRAGESAKHHGDFDVYISEPGGGNRRNLTNSPEIEKQPALSPDGATIAFVRNDRELWLMDSDGTAQRLLSSDFESVGIPQPLVWSPDGRFIVWDRFGELKIVEVATGETFAPAPTGQGCYAYFVAWTPDSTQIYLRTQCAFDGL